MSKPKNLPELSGQELREYAEHLMGFTFKGVPMPVGKINYPPKGKQFDPANPPKVHWQDTYALDTVLVRGEYRVRGSITPEELQDLERDHESGDIRAEHTLALLLGK